MRRLEHSLYSTHTWSSRHYCRNTHVCLCTYTLWDRHGGHFALTGRDLWESLNTPGSQWPHLPVRRERLLLSSQTFQGSRALNRLSASEDWTALLSRLEDSPRIDGDVTWMHHKGKSAFTTLRAELTSTLLSTRRWLPGPSRARTRRHLQRANCPGASALCSLGILPGLSSNYSFIRHLSDRRVQSHDLNGTNMYFVYDPQLTV